MSIDSINTSRDAVRTQVELVLCNLEYFRQYVSGCRVEIIEIQRSRFNIIQTTRAIMYTGVLAGDNN